VTPARRMTRRDFLTVGAAATGGMLLSLSLPGWARERPARGFSPNAWIQIDPDGRVTLTVDRSEMGQGARTALAMLLAEELGADWNSIRVAHARPGPDFRNMRTSGSSAVADRWDPLRIAGAAAREMLVAAAAARWAASTAECAVETGQIIHRPTGRRIAFGAVASDAARLPVPRHPRLKDPKQYTIVGRKVAHLDAPAIAAGTAEFGIDVRLPGMLYASVVHCPVYGGTVQGFDDSAARKIAGFRGVAPISTGLAVVAESTWAALSGCEALKVQWNEGAKAREDSAEYEKRLEEALRRGGRATRSDGDAAAALEKSASRLDATYRYSFQAHATLEPMNCVARVGGGRCEVWAPTQAPNQAQEEAARVLGIGRDDVDLRVPLLGGGFGRRLGLDYVTEAVEIARAVGAPVQLLWPRAEDMQHDMYNPAAIHEFAAGLDARGRPVAWRHRCATFHLSMFGKFDPNDPDLYEGSPWGGADIPYAFDALQVEYAPLESPVPTGAWRSVEYPSTVFARESFLDEIARATGADPLSLRLRLLPSPGIEKVGRTLELPNGDRLRAVLDLAARKSDWKRPFVRARGGRRYGRGIACNAYHRQTMVAQVAEVSVGPENDVRVHRVVCAIDCGRPVNLSGIEGQVESGILWGLSAALQTRITFQRGRAEQSNFDDFPVIRMSESPRIETHIVSSDIRPLGVGEQPVPPVFGAVANAIYDATGKRIRRAPMGPELRDGTLASRH
jgi:isoquinoline 1-oxidoreductase beta subunit